MTKAETIRFLDREGCSAAEIALAVGYSEGIIKLRLAVPRLLKSERIDVAFRSWRGRPIGGKVVSL